MPGRLMIALITIFGAMRFGARALVSTAAIRIPGTRNEWTLLACFVVAVAWLSLHPFDPIGERAFHFAARCLVVTSAVLTGDYLMGAREREPAKRIDTIGSIALLAGITTPMYALLEPTEPTPDLWDLWFRQSYLAALLVCVAGRAAEKIAVSRPA